MKLCVTITIYGNDVRRQVSFRSESDHLPRVGERVELYEGCTRPVCDVYWCCAGKPHDVVVVLEPLNVVSKAQVECAIQSMKGWKVDEHDPGGPHG